ncbi:hypothetical protein DFH09DRAFT_1504275 [Mycena vulgaris]|nr:hypothetical protein DFH09DRAFT_1504275 [Mycena vulgaris]
MSKSSRRSRHRARKAPRVSVATTSATSPPLPATSAIGTALVGSATHNAARPCHFPKRTVTGIENDNLKQWMAQQLGGTWPGGAASSGSGQRTATPQDCTTKNVTDRVPLPVMKENLPVARTTTAVQARLSPQTRHDAPASTSDAMRGVVSTRRVPETWLPTCTILIEARHTVAMELLLSPRAQAGLAEVAQGTSGSLMNADELLLLINGQIGPMHLEGSAAAGDALVAELPSAQARAGLTALACQTGNAKAPDADGVLAILNAGVVRNAEDAAQNSDEAGFSGDSETHSENELGLHSPIPRDVLTELNAQLGITEQCSEDGSLERTTSPSGWESLSAHSPATEQKILVAGPPPAPHASSEYLPTFALLTDGTHTVAMEELLNPRAQHGLTALALTQATSDCHLDSDELLFVLNGLIGPVEDIVEDRAEDISVEDAGDALVAEVLSAEARAGLSALGEKAVDADGLLEILNAGTVPTEDTLPEEDTVEDSVPSPDSVADAQDELGTERAAFEDVVAALNAQLRITEDVSEDGSLEDITAFWGTLFDRSPALSATSEGPSIFGIEPARKRRLSVGGMHGVLRPPRSYFGTWTDDGLVAFSFIPVDKTDSAGKDTVRFDLRLPFLHYRTYSGTNTNTIFETTTNASALAEPIYDCNLPSTHTAPRLPTHHDPPARAECLPQRRDVPPLHCDRSRARPRDDARRRAAAAF